MKITLALQSPHQVKGACQTTAKYIRIGHYYCSLVSQKTWPIDELRQSISIILKAGKFPQLTLPICPLDEGEEKYWEQNKQLLRDFPQIEVVISNWGLIELPVINPKIASIQLNAINTQEVSMLQEAGVKVVALPLTMRDGDQIRQLILNNSEMDFEYYLDGQTMTGFNWFCRAEEGTKPGGNGHDCLTPKYFMPSTDESLPTMQSRGNILWLDQQMTTLHQVRDLAKWGMKRGVITWGEYDLNILQELIGLYQTVLAEGVAIIQENRFYQELRKQLRFHHFN